MDLYNSKFIIRDLIQLKFPWQNPTLHETDWYYFLHIPKTAGTSFRFSLYNYFPPGLTYPNTVEYYLRQKSQYISWLEFVETQSSQFPAVKKLLIGHFGLSPLDYYQKNRPKSLCFLRDPVKRVMSTIIYHQLKNRRFADLSIDEILEKHLLREGSLQSIYLGYDHQKQNIQETLENLNKLAFIGISEQFDRSLKLCNRTFGWNLKSVKPRNVGKYKPSVFSNEQIARIQEITDIDRLVYDTGVKLFNRRCEDLNLV